MLTLYKLHNKLCCVSSQSSSSRGARWAHRACRACRATLFDKLDTTKMHGLDTSSVSSPVVSRRDKLSGIWVILRDVGSDLQRPEQTLYDAHEFSSGSVHFLFAVLLCGIVSLLQFIISTVIQFSDVHSSRIYLAVLFSINCYPYIHWNIVIHSIDGDLVRGLGGRGRRVSAEKIFLPSPPKCEIWGGDGGGLTVFANFNI